MDIDRSKLFGLLLVLLVIVGFAILVTVDLQTVYEPALLLTVLNTLFVGLLPVVVAGVAAWAYMRTGSWRTLLIGSGMLAFGLGAIATGWLPLLGGGVNEIVTVYNTCALLSGILFLFGAARYLHNAEPATTHAGVTLAMAYGSVLAFVALVTVMAMRGITPPFFVQGTGPTTIRQIVLGGAILCYASSALVLLYQYAHWRLDFLYWYPLSLILIAIGLSAVMFQRSVGTPLGWLGRSSQYLGGIFALIAILAALRSAITKGVPLDTVLTSFFLDAEANYRALVETATDAIISFDQDCRVILWNSAAERMFGYKKGAATGISFLDLASSQPYADTARAAFETAMAGLPSGATDAVTEIEGQRQDGACFPVEFTLSARRVPTGWVGTCILRDVTARKQAEAQIKRLNETLEARVIERTTQLSERVAEVEQLNRATVKLLEELKVANQQATESAQRLKTANAELETFTYSVSHDLKAPLRGIDGYSRLLLDGYADQLDDDGRTFLHNICRASGQMGQLIDDLLTYSRMERRALHTAQIDPRGIVEIVLAERSDEITQRGVSVTASIACETVLAEPEGLTQIMRNLLDNALKFTRDIPSPAITIGGRDTGATCVLWITDNGTGFDMKYHDRIFEIFQRLHRQEDYPGTGIGLAIVRKVIARMGGRTWAESIPGQGATFYLEVPK